MDQNARRRSPRPNLFQHLCHHRADLINRCLTGHIGAFYSALKRQIIDIDGKRLRGSHGLDTEACHVVSSSAAESGLNLAQEYVADRSNEMTTIPHLIEVLALSGQIITRAAMGTHTHSCGHNMRRSREDGMVANGVSHNPTAGSP